MQKWSKATMSALVLSLLAVWGQPGAAQSPTPQRPDYTPLNKLPDWSGVWVSYDTFVLHRMTLPGATTTTPPLKDPALLARFKAAQALIDVRADNTLGRGTAPLRETAPAGRGAAGGRGGAAATGRGRGAPADGGDVPLAVVRAAAGGTTGGGGVTETAQPGGCGGGGAAAGGGGGGGFNGRLGIGPDGRALEILFTPGRVTMDAKNGGLRRIYTDGTRNEDPDFITAMGVSTGHWEGETLVIDTEALSPRTMLLGVAQAGKGFKVHERWFLKEPDVLVNDTTLEAPEIFTQPYTLPQQLFLRLPYTFQMIQDAIGECVEEDRSVDPAGGQKFDLTPPADIPPPPRR